MVGRADGELPPRAVKRHPHGDEWDSWHAGQGKENKSHEAKEKEL
jgi:hypothetical protein